MKMIQSLTVETNRGRLELQQLIQLFDQGTNTKYQCFKREFYNVVPQVSLLHQDFADVPHTTAVQERDLPLFVEDDDSIL